jgi:hypothetical protein
MLVIDCSMQSKLAFAAVLIAVLLCGILRSAIATRLDSFDLDEAYHITAGVTYARLGDYRLNPEHPPLVKLWVGAFLTPDVFKAPQVRPLADKLEERHFTEDVVFTQNDPDVVQRRARIAMFLLNSVLALAFGLAVWRAFGKELGPLMATGALTFLMIDPTIAAHLPVVLTDLPIALLGSTAVLLAWSAFRCGRYVDVVLAGLCLGLALGAKHTALIVVVAVSLLGIVMLLLNDKNRLRALGQLVAVLLLAWITLWGLYRFRFNESPVGVDLFNRTLSAKVADLHRPHLRNTVSFLADTHFLPRSYLWGLADILHVGVEGIRPVFFLGHNLKRAPFYFFPTVLLVKVPLGLLALAFAGGVLVLSTRNWAGTGPLFGLSPVCMLTAGHAHDRHFSVRWYPPRPNCSALACRAGSRCLGDCLATKITYVACGYRPCSFRSGSVGGPGAASLGVLQRDRRHAERLAVFRRRRSRFRAENERDRRLLSSVLGAERRTALRRLQ